MIIGDGIILGTGGETASIFVTGLSETDTVTATNGTKTLSGKWATKSITVTGALIPTMTSNTEPYGVAIASAEYEGNLAYKAFDGNSKTCAYGSINTIPWTLQYDFEKIVSIESFSYIVSQPSAAGNRTGTHNVEISMDGTSWETIFTGTTTEEEANPKSDTVYLDTKKSARYIRWVTTSMTGGYNPSENLHSLQVYGDAEVSVSGFEIKPISDYGTWAVTATDGIKTATQNVLVDSANVFNVKLKFVDANTVLLLHAEDFTDSSLNKLTVTNTNVTLSDNSKFGSKSFYFNGSNAKLNITPTSKFEFGTGDFTFDMWVLPETISGDNFFINGSSSGAFFFGINANKKIGYGRASVTWDKAYSVSFSFSEWTHIALVRASGVVTIYINGTSIGSDSYTTPVTYNGGDLNIGSQNNSFRYNGFIDEVRISNIARWTSNFTPPAEPY